MRYVHAEDYYADVVRAYQQKSFDVFKRYYRSLDLLLVDDIQFFNNKNRTQEEFFYAFNALIEARKQVVITCDTYPKDITGLEDRLISRFDWGLTVAIEPPELEMRVAILKKKAEVERMDLSDDVAFLIAKNLRSNVRELEGALKKVLAFARFHRRDINLDLAKEALKDLLGAHNRQITLEDDPEDRRRLLQDQGRGHVFEEAHSHRRPPTPGGHVAGQGTYASQLPCHRRILRRTRSHDGAPCLPHHLRTAPDRSDNQS